MEVEMFQLGSGESGTSLAIILGGVTCGPPFTEIGVISFAIIV